MSFGEIAGYIASILVFATFYVKTMLPLRMIAIASNFTFIIYAFSENLIPVFILHTLLLPVNITRLYEIKKLVDIANNTSASDTGVETIIPYMKPRRIYKGDTLFRLGDHSDEMFFLVSGRLKAEEINKFVEKGELVGEIGLFSPYRRRTATVIAETDCRLLAISDAALYRAYYQNPKLGFALIRLISRRFAEIYVNSVADVKTEPPTEVELESALPSKTSMGEREPHASKASGFQWPSLAVFFAASASILLLLWLFYPFLDSVLTRNAVVTAWKNTVTTPIDGSVVSAVPEFNTIMRSDFAVKIENNTIDERFVTDAAQNKHYLKQKVVKTSSYIDSLLEIQKRYNKILDNYEYKFDLFLTKEITALKRVLRHLNVRIEIEERNRKRLVDLGKGGHSTQSQIDVAVARVSQLRQEHSEKEQLLSKLNARLDAQRDGVHLDNEGDKQNWVRTASDTLELEINRSIMTLKDTQDLLIKAEAVYDAARRDLNKKRAAAASIPAGAYIWQSLVRQDQFVTKGDPLVSWVDCKKIMVDVSVSDAELSIIKSGSAATVVIDGEKSALNGIVRHVRGSTARIPSSELASTAAGSDLHAQVIVEVPAFEAQSGNCLVGTTAWVDFPDFDLLDVVWARLRF